MKTYEETLKGILDIPKFTTKNSLEHTREFLKRLGNPQENFRIIHVAGSNGKGSVCAWIASVLRENGKQTGLFTSPHLVKIEERFETNEGPCTPMEFVEAASLVQHIADEMVAEGMPHPTFFEYIFAVGMVIFSGKHVEYAVLETGMGGRLDATNVIRNPLLTVITSISLEHTEILGDTISEIAGEKAGILKPGVPVIYDASQQEAAEVIRQRAKELGCTAVPVFLEKIKILLNTGKKIDFYYDSGYDVTEVTIPFGAPYQAVNAAVALQAVKYLQKTEGIPKEAVSRGMAQVSWKGRMQEAGKDIYFDGAHNTAGAAVFLQAVKQLTQEPAVLLFSMVQEKDYHKVIKELVEADIWKQVFVTAVPNARGIGTGQLKKAFEHQAALSGKMLQITEIEDIEHAFREAAAARSPGQKLFCAGSLYLIGELERITGGMKDD